MFFPLTWNSQKQCPSFNKPYLCMIRRETPFPRSCPVCPDGQQREGNSPYRLPLITDG